MKDKTTKLIQNSYIHIIDALTKTNLKLLSRIFVASTICRTGLPTAMQTLSYLLH